ncbi:MAG TPA: GAF and ANTAR domain-containing protein [Intrasporangium sp.]|uniref:GAF and ANTAR domain-containing protein n=1 Tax=Intrasporangium sp. TaxID=1925024 RepID=UPI002D77CF34|nr:GAF and ANTAR domain-containing protein [Intrasporangium sp.]HET7399179.1 GAF and ANTAR domain-containing protein [Intrasporangium sp.]
MDYTAFLEDLARLAHRLLTAYDLDETLDDLVASVTRDLGLVGTAVDLADGDGLRCVTAVPPSLRELAKVQSSSRGGPALDAYRSRAPRTVADLAAVEQPWPDYRAVARRLGLAAVASVPMALRDETLGVLTLYSDAPRQWSEADLLAASLMADLATGYFVNSSRLRHQEQLTSQLQYALESRVVIEQAKGITASALGISVEDAFERLRRHARSHHTKVRTVAEAVVTLGLRV